MPILQLGKTLSFDFPTLHFQLIYLELKFVMSLKSGQGYSYRTGGLDGLADFYLEIIVFKSPEVYQLYEALQSKECISADRILYKFFRLKLFIITNIPELVICELPI